jgi:hypothetical protein
MCALTYLLYFATTFQDNKMFLNWLKLAIFLKSSGGSFHKTAAVYLKEFLP